jgi:hypothetical protein
LRFPDGLRAAAGLRASFTRFATNVRPPRKANKLNIAKATQSGRARTDGQIARRRHGPSRLTPAGAGRGLNLRVFLDAVQEDVAMSDQQQEPSTGETS